jgi:hypothetical protein
MNKQNIERTGQQAECNKVCHFSDIADCGDDCSDRDNAKRWER